MPSLQTNQAALFPAMPQARKQAVHWLEAQLVTIQSVA